MLKRLIGISAALSMLIVASAADASPRSPMQRVQQVARFAPGAASRTTTPTVRSHVERTHKSPAMVRKPGAERIRPVVDMPSRAHRVRIETTQTRSQSGAVKVENKNVHQYARCTEVASCGNASRSASQKPVHRLMTAEQQNDPIAVERARLRAKRIISMVKAKVKSAKFKGE